MKKISVLGTGIVGSTIATKLIELGYEVKMGSRTSDNEHAINWASKSPKLSSYGTFAQSAAFGDIIFNCTKGENTLQALQLAGHENLQGKTLIDVANPLDFSKGMPPTLIISNTDSLGETIQRQFPDVKVVKALNTINCRIMVNPNILTEKGTIFISGNHQEAKNETISLLKQFGWSHIIDLGDIKSARGTEQFLPLWIQIMQALGTANFNVKVVAE